MNFTDFVSAGVSTLADFDRDVAMAAGLSTGRVRDLARVHHTYCRSTNLSTSRKNSSPSKAQPNAGASGWTWCATAARIGH